MATSEITDAMETPDAARHPGALIRQALKGAGFSIPAAAVAIGVNRANLNNIILGKTALSHDMAYRLNVLTAPEDEEFALTRAWLRAQAEHDWLKTAPMRRLARVVGKRCSGPTLRV